MLALLLGGGLALAGWTTTATDNGCTFQKGTTEASGVTPIHVECDWPVAPATLHEIFAHPGDQARVFASLAESETLARSANQETVRQVHAVPGAADREVTVVYTTTEVPGGRRYTWAKAPDQAPTQGRVEPEVNEGYWEVTERGGQSHLVYEFRYLAGGNIPAFLVRSFQGSGIKDVIADLRDFAERVGR